METILEQQRRYHEERERVVEEMVKEKLHKKTSHRDQINGDHRLRHLLDRRMEVDEMLEELYEDRDGIRKAEVNALSGPNEFGEFYSRLKAIRDFYVKHPNEIAVPMSVEFRRFADAREQPQDELNNIVEFSAEEGYGKFLDLHECYNKYINLRGVDPERTDYLGYVGVFDHLFDAVPRDKKSQADYRKYVAALADYLADFLSRVRPLLDIDRELREADDEFETAWAAGSFPGWTKEAASAMAQSGSHLDLSAFSSWEELASLGLDRLKSALKALGLKCGGTLDERAKRLFATKGNMLDDLDPSLFAKKSASAGADGAKKPDFTDRQKEVARMEAGVYKLAEHLMEQKQATRENVQRKQARTRGEEDVEDEEDAAAAAAAAAESDDEEDEDDIPYNPKNLPLGWDGKPIPYWLYKLHGLNIDFQCEICGNYKYRGPKAFQRHFSESWRHAHGMRCLGIPNTAHFANIVSIEAAVNLWNKIKDKNEARLWTAETEEEFEDSLGNVVNKKIFEDLKRQGLL